MRAARPRFRAGGRIGPLLLALAAGACGPPPDQEPGSLAAVPVPDPDPPTALRDMVRSLREGRELSFHPSDGGGKAWLEEPDPARVGQPGRWTLVYEAGPLGIQPGGSLLLMVSPYWGWSTPQPYREDLPGYTTVSTDAAGVELLPQVLGGGGETRPLGVRVGGQALGPGQRLRIVYGAGERGAWPDRYAEAASPFWFRVDGDGDGISGLVAGAPTLEVRAGEPAQLVAIAPSTVRPGDRFELLLTVLDASANAGCELTGEVLLASTEGLELPPRVTLAPDDAGALRVPVLAREPGVYRVAVQGPGGLVALSNPVEVSERAIPLLWGDLHGHSVLSDGTGTPEDYYAYARDVAGLDVAVLTDHDHWGMRTLDAHPDLLQRIQDATRAAHEPGRFVTLHGYEWTSWLHGHRHVLFFDDQLTLFSSLDEATETPAQLWDALRGRPALTFAHHSAGGPIATNWSYAPDPELEPVTEIVSVHGSSEAADSPLPIYSPVAGNFVRDVLDSGQRLGFVGSGDSHDGHPGLAHLAAPNGSGGLVGIFCAERSREAVLAALRARRVYATSGPRILLRATCGRSPMGTNVAAAASVPLVLFVHGTRSLESVELIRSGQVVERVTGLEGPDATLSWDLVDLAAGEYVYARVVQEDGSAAWTSPFFVDPAP